MTTQEFIDNFKYTPDGRIDSWRIINDTLEGDCDDFATTVLYLESGSLLKFWLNVIFLRASFHFVTTGTENHVVLKYKGKYIDNIKPQWRDSVGFKRKFPWVFIYPLVVIKMALGLIWR